MRKMKRRRRRRTLISDYDSDDNSDDNGDDNSDDARYEPPADAKAYIERRFNAHEGAWLQRALQSVLPHELDKAP